jgi:hypothetical protein
MRGAVTEKFTEDKNFKRIRPKEGDRKWKISAGVTLKEGSDKFMLGAP